MDNKYSENDRVVQLFKPRVNKTSQKKRKKLKYLYSIMPKYVIIKNKIKSRIL